MQWALKPLPVKGVGALVLHLEEHENVRALLATCANSFGCLQGSLAGTCTISCRHKPCFAWASCADSRQAVLQAAKCHFDMPML